MALIIHVLQPAWRRTDDTVASIHILPVDATPQPYQVPADKAPMESRAPALAFEDDDEVTWEDAEWQ